MWNHLWVLLIVLYSLLEISKSEYILVNRKANKLNQCHPNNALVEQFFNIIFTEFQRTPPACVCVQMCLESPTYCYPNGCLRKDRRKLIETTTSAYPVNRIQYDGNNPSKSVMFLVDSDKDLIDNIFQEPKIIKQSETIEKPTNELIFRPNPFRELVFKYRKVPKLEMRYNLREKVKNTKSGKIKKEKLDVSRTRWSMNKQLVSGRQLLNRIGHYKRDDDTRRTFFASMFPEIESLSMKEKSLAKREDSSGFNVDTLYIYKTDVANFSVENLIDDLIISSLDDNKDNVKFNKRIHSDLTEITTTETSTDSSNGNFIETTVTNNIEENTTADMILINSTHRDTDKHIKNYTFNINVIKNNKTYLEKIATMSEEIEKNNNITIDFIKRVTGQKLFENETLSNKSDGLKPNFDPKLSIDIEISKMATESNKNNEIITVTKRWMAPVLKNRFNKKSRQRFTRKLNQKLN